jgi:archaellum biogenesis ATPase FlaH
MIRVIVGNKGSGKTARLVEQMNTMAKDETKRVVCVVRGKRLETQIKPQIRLVDINDYPTEGYRELLSFLAGICAKDYDLTDIYVDSVSKVTKVDDIKQFEEFLPLLKPFSEATDVNFTFILSADPEELPETIKSYCN